MKWRNTLAAIGTAALFASGCTGGLDSVPPQDDPPPADTGGDGDGDTPDPGNTPPPERTQGETVFAQSVSGIMAGCAGEACHAGAATAPLKFLGISAQGTTDDFYRAITQYPSVVGGYDPGVANVLLKIAPGNHYGITYTPEQELAIQDWLLQEATDRGITLDQPEIPDDTGEPGGEPGPFVPTDSRQALAQWSGCMTLENWNASQMYTWDNKRTENNDRCQDCHNDGLARFYTNDDNDVMFAMNRLELYVISFFTVRVLPDNSHEVIMARDKINLLGDGSTLHQRYGIGDGNVHIQRLQNFYELTRQNLVNGQCGPPEFPSL